ncbi:hypothetical protein QFC19_003877 [Naganishia cerealis]|uniref:Uncharacterized protein n=1 Tax=Naganishia cerealis TaxID=610337 RepID=A0ACC2W044_9TREE|nr:hypothetical protein QFC19_003877 [Naganishia cerealis]
MPDNPIPQISISPVLRATLDPVAHPRAAEPGSSVGPVGVDSSSGPRPGQGGRMGRIARKPLRLAGSAIRYGLRRQGSAGAGAGAGEPEAVVQARGRRGPLEGEETIATVRVRVVRCVGLVVRDRNGSSDPFVAVSLPPAAPVQTPVVKRSLSPAFPAAQSTFDFPLYASLAASGLYGGRGLELVVWDKDLVKKDYMGEVAVPLTQWFRKGESPLWDDVAQQQEQGQPFDLVSARRRRRVTGKVYLQCGIVLPDNEGDREERARQVVRLLETKAEGHMASLMDVPAYQGIGTVKMKRHRRRSARRKEKSSETSSTYKLASAAKGLISRATKGHRRQAVPASTMTATPAAPLSTIDSGMFAADDDARSEDSDALTADEDDDDDDDDDDEDEEEELRDDGLTSDTDSHDEGFLSEEDDVLLSGDDDSAEESAYPVGEDANDRVGPLVGTTGNNSSATSSSLRVAGGSAAGRRPKRQTSMNSTSSNEAYASVSAATTASQRPRTSTSVSPSPPSETSVRIVSPETQALQQQQQGYFDTVPPPPPPPVPAPAGRRRLFKKSSRDQHLAPVHRAADLPKLRNSDVEVFVRRPSAFRFSFDMDPFVVISFGKKVFRTRVIRHSLNPRWDEKMLFHVRRFEDSFSIQFAVLDWDKVSGNDFIGSSTIPLAELVADAPKPDAQTGLYGPKEDGKHEMKEFRLPITTPKDASWETKHSPDLKVRAKYEPYDALRQRFWRQYLTQYDTDDTCTISYTELTTMLDSLGSTLTSSTLHSYYERYQMSYEEGELTYDQVIQCLEEEIQKQRKEKRRLSESTAISGVATPAGYPMAPRPAQEGLDYAGQSAAPPASVDADELARHIRASAPRADTDSEGNGDINVKPLPKIDNVKGKLGAEQHLAVGGAPSPDMSPGESEIDDGLQDSSSPGDTERIVNIKTCPLCHRPRLNKKSEADIITHLAVCASADWSRVDRIVVGNYVTASQAQRKFLSKVLTKLSSGAYSLGANSANIIVQDRATGQVGRLLTFGN